MKAAQFDVVVIGGGPGGAMTAMLLAKLGWRAALVDRRERFGAKACGHCLSPRVHDLLAQCDLLEDVEHIATGRTSAMHLHIAGREPLVVNLAGDSEAPPGWIIDRARFDQLLIDKAAAAGVEIHRPASASVEHITPDAASVRVRSGSESRMLRASLVVGADGLRSAVARSAGLLCRSRTGRRYGFSMDMTPCGVSSMAADVVHMFTSPRGYLGVVRGAPGSLHMAGLVRANAASSTGPYEFISALARTFPLLRNALGTELRHDAVHNFKAAGPMPCRPRRVANERFALVGDAAGYHEPFTGEGMSWAMRSAGALAYVLSEQAPGVWTRGAANAYQRAWRRGVGRRLRDCSMFSWTLHRPSIFRAARDVAAFRPSLANALARRVAAS